MIESSFFIRDSPSHGVQFGHPGSGPDPPGDHVGKQQLNYIIIIYIDI
jgi:hypothetical protein